VKQTVFDNDRNPTDIRNIPHSIFSILIPYERKEVWGSERRFLKIVENLALFGIKTNVLEEHRPLSSNIYTSFPILGEFKRDLLRLVIYGIKIVRLTHSSAIYAYHADQPYSVVPCVLISWLTFRPLYIVVHDNWMQKEDTSPLHEIFETRIAKGHATRSSLVRIFMQLIKRCGFKTASTCFCPSETVTKYARHVLGIPRVLTTGCGVDEFWKPAGDVAKKYDAVFVGRIDRAKGLDCLLRAWRIVTSKLPNAKLIIVGDSAEGEVGIKKFRQLIESFSLEQNVILAGQLTDEELLGVLQSSQIFVSASLREGFGLSVAEAMAVGLPCIVSDIPAFRENFAKAAVLVPPDQPLKFAEEIVKLLNDETARSDLANKSLKLARIFNWQSVALREAHAMNLLNFAD
jgi:glycosyltransferase involved in cell wall biosynthesis